MGGILREDKGFALGGIDIQCIRIMAAAVNEAGEVDGAHRLPPAMALRQSHQWAPERSTRRHPLTNKRSSDTGSE